MNMLRPYSHTPVAVINEDGQRECLRCPRPLTPIGATLRHADEAVPMRLSAADVAALRTATDVIERALADMPTDRCTDRDRAHVAAEALHRRGFIVTRPRHHRPSSAA